MSQQERPADIKAGALVQFYLGRTTDDRGRTIDDIQSWGDSELEHVHDYIQWLFPLRERSGANPSAPILDSRQVTAFRANDELRGRLRQSFGAMLSFYGLQCEDTSEGPKVTKTNRFESRKATWLTNYNHNYLRITRILTSLRLLGLEEYADAFFTFLEQLYKEEKDRIGETTFGYWKRALAP